MYCFLSQCILGGVHVAAERFNDKFFQKFRSENIVEAAVNYARVSGHIYSVFWEMYMLRLRDLVIFFVRSLDQRISWEKPLIMQV